VSEEGFGMLCLGRKGEARSFGSAPLFYLSPDGPSSERPASPRTRELIFAVFKGASRDIARHANIEMKRPRGLFVMM
jgi:hypothetical protein